MASGRNVSTAASPSSGSSPSGNSAPQTLPPGPAPVDALAGTAYDRAMIDRYFALDAPFPQFPLAVLAISCLGIGPLLAVYVGLTPGFTPMLLGGGLGLRLFARQVLTDGLLVVYIVNYFGFLVYAASAAPRRRGARRWPVLVVDPPLRAALFVGLHALIYFNSADLFGSFAGDHWLALRVVGPTLARSARFENLEGVYLYATLVGALPIYAVVVDRLLARNGGSGPPAPRRLAAIVLAAALCALCALLVTAIADAIVFLQRS